MTESTNTPSNFLEYGTEPVAFTVDAQVKPNQDLKITGDMTMGIATGTDVSHGRANGHAEANTQVSVSHYFRGGIGNVVVDTTAITAGNYVKPTGVVDASTGLPEYELESVEKTQFVAVTGGLDRDTILVGTL